MDDPELSDLEEGEILEYDSVSPSDTAGVQFGVRNFTLEGLTRASGNEQFGLKENRYLYSGPKNKGYVNQRLKEKLKLNEKFGRNNLNLSMVDLESISSDGECRSDEENKNSVAENKYFPDNNAEDKVRGAFYGTVEDIMSEIGETICRNSRCNYKKRKSKELKQNLDKCSATSYDLWRREIFFCRLKSKRRKRKTSFSDSNSDLPKERTERRKRRKKKRVLHYEECETGGRKSKVRDFDEVRRNLLEKLKKQKAEEESKASANDQAREGENSEIQEVDMLIDCTNYVDDAQVAVPGNSTEEREGIKRKEGEEKEDELDLAKLRLIALASNKNRKSEEDSQKGEKLDSVSLGKKCFNGDRKDLDLDRNELLLRAEALKSALLKKHQKRLNRLKVKKSCTDSFSDHDMVKFASAPPAEDSANCDHSKIFAAKNVGLTVDVGTFKSSPVKEREKESGRDPISSTPASALDPGTKENEINEAVLLLAISPFSSLGAFKSLRRWQTKTNSFGRAAGWPQEGCRKTDNFRAYPYLTDVNGKRSLQKARTKRKKSKSSSFGNSLKEINEKGEATEEDDRMLRSQLLDDLIKKKSLKNLEKKPVLTDSAQAPSDKPTPPVMGGEPPKERGKPLPTVKTSAPRKVNAPKTSKSAAMLKIPKPEIQRIIVHLGSEDSSDEDVVSPWAPGQPPGTREDAVSARELKKESGTNEAVKLSHVNKEAGKMVRADYERSVELLLSQARKKIEGKKQSAKETLTTPEAVYKHLPPSQRLEYIRLKQKIAERERLKLRNRVGKKENSGVPTLAPGDPETAALGAKESAESASEMPEKGNFPKVDPEPQKSPSHGLPLLKIGDMNHSLPGNAGNSASICKITGSLADASGAKPKEPNQRLTSNKVKNNLVGFCRKGLKKSVAPPGNGLKAALPIQRSTLLLPSNQALISKLKLLLKKIKIEKMIEENYGKEISKLRNQLSLFERKQSEQRFKIKKLGEESMKTYKAIQGITVKSNEKATRKENVEKEKKEDRGVPKEEGKKPEEGKNVSDEPVTEITKAQGKSEKGPKSSDNVNETEANGAGIVPSLGEYSSPLHMFNKVVDCSKRVDPNVIMCQFDLMGVCKDEECTYQHLRNS